MKPVLTGMAIGAIICAMAIAVVGGLAVRKKAIDARRGWNLVPVVVAAADVAEGEPITLEKVSQRSLPEQFVNESNVTPDEVKPLIGRKLSVPVQAGDPLVWGMFAETASAQRVDACLKAIHPALKEAFSRAALQAAKDFEIDHPKTVTQPKVTADAEGNVQVVAAADDIDEGTTVTREKLKVISMHQSLMTDSVVPAGALPKLVGAKVSVPVVAGEVVIWQQLDPGGPLACNFAMLGASEKACAEAAAGAVAKFNGEEAR